MPSHFIFEGFTETFSAEDGSSDSQTNVSTSRCEAVGDLFSSGQGEEGFEMGLDLGEFDENTSYTRGEDEECIECISISDYTSAGGGDSVTTMSVLTSYSMTPSSYRDYSINPESTRSSYTRSFTPKSLDFPTNFKSGATHSSSGLKTPLSCSRLFSRSTISPVTPKLQSKSFMSSPGYDNGSPGTSLIRNSRGKSTPKSSRKGILQSISSVSSGGTRQGIFKKSSNSIYSNKVSPSDRTFNSKLRDSQTICENNEVSDEKSVQTEKDKFDTTVSPNCTEDYCDGSSIADFTQLNVEIGENNSNLGNKSRTEVLHSLGSECGNDRKIPETPRRKSIKPSPRTLLLRRTLSPSFMFIDGESSVKKTGTNADKKDTADEVKNGADLITKRSSKSEKSIRSPKTKIKQTISLTLPKLAPNSKQELNHQHVANEINTPPLSTNVECNDTENKMVINSDITNRSRAAARSFNLKSTISPSVQTNRRASVS